MAGIFEVKFRTPAKINLFLKITGKREDGYHTLYSLFVPISLYDEVAITRITRNDRIEVKFSGWDIDSYSNSVVQAINVFRKKSGIKDGYKIKINKNIPPGGGLGGGSSDAAATLKLLNLLYGCIFSKDELVELAASIGADVPFFLHPVPSIANGVGDVLTDYKINRKIWLILVYPRFESSTPLIYKAFDDLTNNLHTIKIKQTKFSSIDLLFGINDLEIAFLNAYREGLKIKNFVERFDADFRGMSGSGSSWFLAFFNRRRRDKIAKEIKKVAEENGYLAFSVNILQ